MRAPKTTSQPRNEESRPVRSDARRNAQALLEAAMQVFATSGVEAPSREIAEKAGVGVGTLYRHFPQRSDLVVAVFRNEVDACANAASSFAAKHAPGEALARWMQRYVDLIAAKRGLAGALSSDDPAFQSLPGYFLDRVRPALQSLLESAIDAGDIRSDVDADELLFAVARLCKTDPYGGSPEQARRMVALLVDGLRHGAPSPRRERKTGRPSRK